MAELWTETSAAAGATTPPLTSAPDGTAGDGLGDANTLTVEPQRFAIVPEWLLDADVSDCAVRLYAVLLRYGHTSGARMPSRALLARRLKKGSVDTVDRAMKELVALGAVTVERRRNGRVNLTNRYHLRASDPSSPEPGGRSGAATPTQAPPGPLGPAAAGPAGTGHVVDPGAGPGSRTAAATPTRRTAATPGRAAAATVAAPVRPDREGFTQSTTSSPDPHTSTIGTPRDHRAGRPHRRPGVQLCDTRDLLDACGLDDLDGLGDALSAGTTGPRSAHRPMVRQLPGRRSAPGGGQPGMAGPPGRCRAAHRRLRPGDAQSHAAGGSRTLVGPRRGAHDRPQQRSTTTS